MNPSPLSCVWYCVTVNKNLAKPGNTNLTRLRSTPRPQTLIQPSNPSCHQAPITGTSVPLTKAPSGFQELSTVGAPKLLSARMKPESVVMAMWVHCVQIPGHVGPSMCRAQAMGSSFQRLWDEALCRRLPLTQG